MVWELSSCLLVLQFVDLCILVSDSVTNNTPVRKSTVGAYKTGVNSSALNKRNAKGETLLQVAAIKVKKNQ